MSSLKPKVFIGFREVAGNYSNLQKGLSKLNIDCCFLNIKGSKFHDNVNKSNSLIINWLNNFAHKLYKLTHYNFITKVLWQFLFSRILLIPVFVYSIFKYNVYIFAYKESFFFKLDLIILKILRKKIIFQFHGSDVRPVYMDGSRSKNKAYISFLLNLLVIIDIRIIELFANEIVVQSTTTQFLKKDYIDTNFLGKPFSFVNVHQKTKKTNDNLVILHIPSNPELKGTNEIRKAVNEVISENTNLKIEYREQSNIKHQKVLEEIQAAGILIDQLYSDIHLPSISKESFFLKTTTIVGGYFFNNDIYNNPLLKVTLPPTIVCKPKDLKVTLVTLINNPDLRIKSENECFEYAVNYCDSMKVAANYLKMFENKIEHLSPLNNCYIYGCGTSKENLKINLKNYVEKVGFNALLLNHNKKLKKSIIEFINN